MNQENKSAVQTRLLVGPFSRVEGDLEVTLEVVDGHVSSAHVNAPMYRGFEQMLVGKHPMDALVIVPRICGICSVSQSIAAARALANFTGVSPPPNGQHVNNLILATENLADHLTHFYLSFMPDFCRPIYQHRPWYSEVKRRFAAQSGEHVRSAIAARQRWLTMLGTMAGKWPHTQTIEPGGSTRAIEAAERIRLLAKVREYRRFLEKQLFGVPLEQLDALQTEEQLLRLYVGTNAGGSESQAARSDFAFFLTVAQDVALISLGAGPGRYLSFGTYTQPGGAHALPSGVWHAERKQCLPLDAETIREDVTSAWLSDDAPARHPSQGRTVPDADKAGAYTWNKAPRLEGKVVETGAIARQLMGNHPLMRGLVSVHGGTVYTRVVGRLLELARVIPMMEAWLQSLQVSEPFCVPTPQANEGAGVGLSEAARGALGHWLLVKKGRIVNYQIIAPTSWNFSPRDAQGTPGALEQALVGAPVQAGESTPVAVQHIVRSFDPCMVCTVH